jgi:hypothetical protein
MSWTVMVTRGYANSASMHRKKGNENGKRLGTAA